MSEAAKRRAAVLAVVATLAGGLIGAVPAGASPAQRTIFESTPELLYSGQPLRDFTLNELQAFGVDTVRVLVYWRNIAPAPNSSTKPGAPFNAFDHTTYPQGDLHALDNLIGAIRARGMTVMLTVTGPFPMWASQSGQSQVLNPKREEYGAFMYAMGTRYNGNSDPDGNPSTPSPDVDIWGVYNEPNVKVFLGPQYSASGKLRAPKIYRNLYLSGYAALYVSGNKDDAILLGETGPRGSPRAIPPLKFLKSVLCLDKNWKMSKGCDMLPTNGLATHPYSFRKKPWEPSDHAEDLNYGNLPKLVDLLDRAAAAGAIPAKLPIYITEYGVQSEPDPYTGVDVQTQAEYLAISEYIAYRNPRIASFDQYLMRDDPRDLSGSPYGGFETGLRYANGILKPSYHGFPVPLVVKRHDGAEVRIWGHARVFRRLGSPIDFAQMRIRILDPGKKARDLKTVELNSGGYFLTTGLYRADRQWRLVWELPGYTYKGPWTRSYSF